MSAVLLNAANLTEPIFQLGRMPERFIAILLVHHLFNEEDIARLGSLKGCNLADEDTRALAVLREMVAINNATYRHVTGVDTASAHAPGLYPHVRLCIFGDIGDRAVPLRHGMGGEHGR